MQPAHPTCPCGPCGPELRPGGAKRWPIRPRPPAVILSKHSPANFSVVSVSSCSTSGAGLLSLLLLLVLPADCPAEAGQLLTNLALPGIVFRSETRPDPPTRLFIAEIDLTRPNLCLRVAPGGPDPDGPGRWQTTLMPPTQIAAREGFDLVVNGDFFDARGIKDAEGTNSTYRAEVWGAATGPAVTDGRIWSTGATNRPCLVVHRNRKVTIETLDSPTSDDWEVVAGNTMLVQDGAAVPHQNKVRHPRTVAGLDATGTRLVLLVVDGRKPGVAVGMNYDELTHEMLRLGCRQALNLDGGGSSVMAVRDPASKDLRILNEPTDGHERPVANALGVTVNCVIPAPTAPRR